MSAKSIPRNLLVETALVIASGGIIAFALLMGTKIVPYFQFNPLQDFLGTKTDVVLAKPYFQVAFYLHIASSFGVMLVGALQLLPGIYRWQPKAHRILGLIYAVGILVLAAPSGLVLAWYANGGLPAKVGFSLQCGVWWLLTAQAWYWARQRAWPQHSAVMLRSLAVTLAAMSLRLESYGLVYWFQTKPIETYLTVTWLSWVGNLALAEILIFCGWSNWLSQAFFGKKS